MRRLLLPVWVLVLSTSVALAAMPCKTREEAMAEAVVGFFLVQKISAERCDEQMGGAAFSALHDRIAQAYAAQRSGAGTTRAGYFKRAYGDAWQEERERVTLLMADLIGASLAISDKTCGELKGALEGRLKSGWEPIQALLAARVEAISATDSNLCQE